MPARNWTRRLAYLRTYVLVIAVASVVWESGQMPLYTLWRTGTPEELVLDVLTCTMANMAIATASLVAGILLTGPITRWERVSVGTLAITCLVGVGYTIYSEWMNVYVKGTWAYSDLMPIVPGLDVGASPLVQWIVLPSVAILFAERWSR